MVCDVPDEVTKIKSVDDYVKNDIRGIRLPNTVTEIMDFAFNDCSNLVYTNLNNRLKTIGDSAFRNTCIEKIIIPNSVTSICNKAFENCTTLVSINITRVFRHDKPIDNLKIIGDNAFENCSFNAFTMPMSVTHIGVKAFKDCTALTNINFNYRYTINGKTLSIPENLQVIHDFAFENTNIKQFYIPDTVTSIGIGIFKNCK